MLWLSVSRIAQLPGWYRIVNAYPSKELAIKSATSDMGVVPWGNDTVKTGDIIGILEKKEIENELKFFFK